MGLELAEVLANRLDRAGARRNRRQQAHQRLIDALREVQGRFRAFVGRRRHAKTIAEFVAALIQVHEPEHCLAQQLTGELQRAAARFGGDVSRIDARATAKRGESEVDSRPRRAPGPGLSAARRAAETGVLDLERPSHHVPGSAGVLLHVGRFVFRLPPIVRRRRAARTSGSAPELSLGSRSWLRSRSAPRSLAVDFLTAEDFDLSVVGDDGALVGREIGAFIDAHQQFVFAETNVVAVLEHVIVVLAQGAPAHH